MQQSLKINNDIFQIESQKLEFDSDSQVYLGTNCKTNEQVTIRLCSIAQQELQILHKIQKSQKENLIEIKYLEQTKENQCIIVMEPIKENFYSFMTGHEFQTITKEQKNMFFYQMVLSVKDFHELGFIHRDVKPENFCLIKKNSKIVVKLFNFNLSRNNGDRFKTLLIGTPLYMTPEVIKKPDYDISIDLWSLGCIWFELITGDTFFKGTQVDLIEKIQTISQQDIQNHIDQQHSLDQDEKNQILQLLQTEAKKRSTIWELEKFFIAKIQKEEFEYYINQGLEKIREFGQFQIQIQQKINIQQNNQLFQNVQNLNQQFNQSKQNFSLLKRQYKDYLTQNQIEIQNIKQLEQLPQVVQQLDLIIVEQKKIFKDLQGLSQKSEQKINFGQPFQLKPPQFSQFK